MKLGGPSPNVVGLVAANRSVRSAPQARLGRNWGPWARALGRSGPCPCLVSCCKGERAVNEVGKDPCFGELVSRSRRITAPSFSPSRTSVAMAAVAFIADPGDSPGMYRNEGHVAGPHGLQACSKPLYSCPLPLPAVRAAGRQARQEREFQTTLPASRNFLRASLLGQADTGTQRRTLGAAGFPAVAASLCWNRVVYRCPCSVGGHETLLFGDDLRDSQV